MLVWIANLVVRLFSPLKPAPALVPARIRIPRRPLRRRTLDG